jgi:uncharacterized membrane protein YgcG
MEIEDPSALGAELFDALYEGVGPNTRTAASMGIALQQRVAKSTRRKLARRSFSSTGAVVAIACKVHDARLGKTHPPFAIPPPIVLALSLVADVVVWYAIVALLKRCKSVEERSYLRRQAANEEGGGGGRRRRRRRRRRGGGGGGSQGGCECVD